MSWSANYKWRKQLIMKQLASPSASSSASSSAAAASSSSSAAASSSSSSSKKQKTTDLCTCIVCQEEYPLRVADGTAHPMWRLPSCGHKLCEQCCRQIIRGSGQFNCPTCRASHPLSYYSSVDERMMSVPTLVDFEKSLTQNDEIINLIASNKRVAAAAVAAAASSSQSAVKYCGEDGCAAVASYYCDACSWLCEQHEEENHIDEEMNEHVRIAAEVKLNAIKEMKEKAEKRKQLQIDNQAKELKQPLIEMKIELESLSTKIDEQTVELNEVSVVSERKKKNDATRATLQQLSDQIEQWNEQLDAEDAATKSSVDHRTSEKGVENKLLKEKMKAMQSLINLASADAVARADELTELHEDAKEIIERIQSQMDDWNSFAVRPLVDVIHPALTMLEQLNSSQLLPSLSESVKGKLNEWLTPLGKSLANAKLIYRSNVNGVTGDDFLECVAEKGPTLMLIKAAGSGYVFGAFTAVSWPEQVEEDDSDDNEDEEPEEEDGAVADPSATSFLFSLTNEYSHPFRLRLVDSTRALCLWPNGAIIIGADVRVDDQTTKYANLVLFNCGRAANEADSFFSNEPDDECAYQLDEEQWNGKEGAEAKPVEFKCDESTFAGSGHFSAAAIELFLF